MDLSSIEMKVENVSKKLEENSFALEMLKELKISSKRWFVISVILLIALIISNIAWLIYKGTFETTDETEQTIIQEQDNVNNSSMSGVIN